MFHAVIKIENINTHYSCSAFVISDNIALTAGHCIKVSKSFMDQVPKIFEKSNILMNKMLADLQEVKDKCKPPYKCEQIQAEIEKAIFEEYTARDQLRQVRVDEFYIHDINGVNTHIIATAFDKEYSSDPKEPPLRDYGIITGDFSKFNKLKIKRKFSAKEKDILKVCGFPGTKVPAICIDFEVMSNHVFALAGKSMFVPGISGSAVIDHDNEVIGIASSATEDADLITPLIGIVSPKEP